jgi:Coenzyme Q (ubiquinone) biosynthesis protein Coq4
MFRLARSTLALSATKPSHCIQSITTHSYQRHELNEKENNDEETPEDENLDEFTKEFLGNKIKVTDFQRILLTAGSSIAALLDPRRQDMIACLGETTGEEALHKVIQVMRESGEGREILKEKPRINTKTVNLEELKNMPEESMGYHYYKFLEDNVSVVRHLRKNLQSETLNIY